ncbi:hypothetical protein SY83_12320 [Paenibacillus swuensis]|uniref:Polyketide cyclase n=1 Tax=Paenibacillus swuensis TaxID=1178515 RepID=A0A172TIR3_9BACL|nr:hypothetical protein [Paenibacillus swuensis]ANE46931.1 hypothetical protein SY83_12320 [Paenibacillus swuensis]
MRQYTFVTEWTFETEIEQVWELLCNAGFSEGWEGLSMRQSAKGMNKDGSGDEYEAVVKTKLPYTLSFTSTVTRKLKPHVLEITVSGELEGRGVCNLSQNGNFTHIRYLWEVDTTKRWMRWLAPVLKPAFVWNHDKVMHDGARTVSRLLGARMVPNL